MRRRSDSRLASGAAAMMLAGALASMASAGPFADFEGDLRSVYATYRSALFSTNAKDKDKSTADIAALAAGWRSLTAKWAKAPPPQYADDPRFAPTLEAAQAEIAAAGRQVGDGDLGTAHLTLEKIRDELGDMRRRNNVSIFSDRMNEYHEHMEKILTRYRGELAPAAAPALRDDAAVLVHLARQLGPARPAEARDAPEFDRLLQATVASAEALRAAAATGEQPSVKSAIEGLKRPFAMFFLKFG